MAITVRGAAPVRLQDGAVVQPGQRVTVGARGTVRALGTLKVQLADGAGIAEIAETASTLGVVLRPAADGTVWVLVNPQ